MENKKSASPLQNFLGNEFGLYPTNRLRNGVHFWLLQIFLLLGWYVLPFYDRIEISWIELPQLDIERYQSYLIALMTSMFIILFIRVAIRNKFSITNYIIQFNVRKALNRNHYNTPNTDVTEQDIKRITVPETKLKWNDWKKTTGQLHIRNSSDKEDKLERINLSSEIHGYNVETVHLSNDNHWYIYSLYSLKSAEKKVFEQKSEFNKWARSVGNYELRFDDRTTQELKHTVIVGATRSGKTYSWMSLLLQMKLKSVKYHLYFIDPKNSDGGTIGKSFSPTQTVVDDPEKGKFTEDVLLMVESFYNKMVERQAELNKLIDGSVAKDYRDFNLEPYYLMIDELPSLVATLDKKEEKRFLELIGNISRLGSGSGFFLIVIAQRLSAKTLPKEIQANMLNKIILGNADNQTYLTAIDRVEDVVNKRFGKGEGIFKDDSMTKPLMVNFPHLKFLDNVDKLKDVIDDDKN